MKKLFYAWVIILGVPCLLLGLVWFDFFVWRKLHPQAPLWTFLFSR